MGTHSPSSQPDEKNSEGNNECDHIGIGLRVSTVARYCGSRLQTLVDGVGLLLRHFIQNLEGKNVFSTVEIFIFQWEEIPQSKPMCMWGM